MDIERLEFFQYIRVRDGAGRNRGGQRKLKIRRTKRDVDECRRKMPGKEISRRERT